MTGCDRGYKADGKFRMGVSDMAYPAEEPTPAHALRWNGLDDVIGDKRPIQRIKGGDQARHRGPRSPWNPRISGMLPHMIEEGSPDVLPPPRTPVDLREFSQWWTL